MPLQQRPFFQVDVFTDTPYRGNPLAVVLDAEGLSDQAMQDFARWTNLSETTFITAPDHQAAQDGADYALRIFTPTAELPFAGHPTLGSCHAWLQAGGIPKRPDAVVQACPYGLITIERRAQQLAFAAPALQRSDASPGLQSAIAEALGIDIAHIQAAQMLNNGPHWLGLLLDSAKRVLDLEPDHARLREIGHKVGVVYIDQNSHHHLLIGRSNREARAFPNQAARVDQTLTQATVRAFAAPLGVPEDPVTGSLNASLAQWLIAAGLAPKRYVAVQGERLGRYGQVHIEQDTDGQVWVGGSVVTCISGQVCI